MLSYVYQNSILAVIVQMRHRRGKTGVHEGCFSLQ